MRVGHTPPKRIAYLNPSFSTTPNSTKNLYKKTKLGRIRGKNTPYYQSFEKNSEIISIHRATQLFNVLKSTLANRLNSFIHRLIIHPNYKRLTETKEDSLLK
jgi:hypothetical protein